MLNKLRKWARRTLLAGVAITALYVPVKLYPRDIEPNPVVHVVEQGDYLSQIAKNQLILEGNNPDIEEIIARTDSLATLNNKGTVRDYPWHEGYDCSIAEDNDPNCIYPGDEITLDPDIPKEGFPWTGLIFGTAVAGATAGIASRIRRGKSETKSVHNSKSKPKSDYHDIEHIIEIKNENPYDSLDKLIEKINHPMVKTEHDLNFFYDLYLKLYEEGKVTKKFLRYDANIAPKNMKEEMIELYSTSDKNMKEIAEELSDKYGMSVSSSTIGKYARKELMVKNRKEAKQTRLLMTA